MRPPSEAALALAEPLPLPPSNSESPSGLFVRRRVVFLDVDFLANRPSLAFAASGTLETPRKPHKPAYVARVTEPTASPETVRVLGIDPGLRLTGYGLVDLHPGQLEPTLVEGGVFRLDAKRPMEQRLVQLRDDLRDVIDEHRPARVAVEQLYAHYAHPRTAILMGHARGVILLCAAERSLPVEHLPSTEVKKSLTGNGHASKRQMQLAVQSQCGLSEPPEPADVADAIAIALCHARRLATEALTRT